MDIQQIVNVTFLLWGSLFCLIGAFYFSLVRGYDPQRGRWMTAMQLSTAVLLFSDGVAYIFRGGPGNLYFWAGRISNFFVFFQVEMTLLFFHRYVCATLLRPEEQTQLRRVKVVNWACYAGMVLIVLSQFTNLYYYFDANNVYHRGTFYPVSMVIPVVGMFCDCSLLLQYGGRISKKLFCAIGSYIFLPLVSVSIQVSHYGWSLIDLSIGLSMILMFLVSASEQNEELRRLESSRAQIAEKLEIATMLNRCVEKISSGKDWDEATNELLEVINDYFNADRSYIFQVDATGRYIINTHEVTREGVTEEKGNLQEVPIEVVDSWLRTFETEEVYMMWSLEQEQGTVLYDVLKPQNIQ